MNTCPFCKRIENKEYDGRSASGVVWFEPLNPVTPGHMLFIPAKHVEHSDFTSYFAVADAMAQASYYAKRHDEDFNLITSSGHNATQTVPHIHIHYVPRRENDGLHLPWGLPHA